MDKGRIDSNEEYDPEVAKVAFSASKEGMGLFHKKLLLGVIIAVLITIGVMFIVTPIEKADSAPRIPVGTLVAYNNPADIRNNLEGRNTLIVKAGKHYAVITSSSSGGYLVEIEIVPGIHVECAALTSEISNVEKK